jgi:hypothetical protein
MIVTDIIKRIENGETYHISFENKTLKLNGYPVSDIEFELPDDIEEKLLEYYRLYKTSVPSKKADSKYFYALDESKLSTKQLAENEPRYIARARLEIYVLGLIINNKWNFGEKQWYWQSKAEPKLTIFKKWFETTKE